MVKEGYKEYPMCAEEVKLKAKICRFCRYEFEKFEEKEKIEKKKKSFKVNR